MQVVKSSNTQKLLKAPRVPMRGVRCEKLDGSWEVPDSNGIVR